VGAEEVTLRIGHRVAPPGWVGGTRNEEIGQPNLVFVRWDAIGTARRAIQAGKWGGRELFCIKTLFRSKIL
jgi:hypothetical protein